MTLLPVNQKLSRDWLGVVNCLIWASVMVIMLIAKLKRPSAIKHAVFFTLVVVVTNAPLLFGRHMWFKRAYVLRTALLAEAIAAFVACLVVTVEAFFIPDMHLAGILLSCVALAAAQVKGLALPSLSLAAAASTGTGKRLGGAKQAWLFIGAQMAGALLAGYFCCIGRAADNVDAPGAPGAPTVAPRTLLTLPGAHGLDDLYLPIGGLSMLVNFCLVVGVSKMPLEKWSKAAKLAFAAAPLMAHLCLMPFLSHAAEPAVMLGLVSPPVAGGAALLCFLSPPLASTAPIALGDTAAAAPFFPVLSREWMFLCLAGMAGAVLGWLVARGSKAERAVASGKAE